MKVSNTLRFFGARLSNFFEKIILSARLFLNKAKREELKRRAFFRWGPMQASAALRQALRVNEISYRHVVGSSHVDPRAYFLYGVLDEVVKACTASMRWNEFLGNGTEELRKDRDRRQNDHTGRVILEAVADEQQLWARKLIEILVDLICFSRTNDQRYFRMYIAARNLDAFLRLQGDLVEFYACRSANVDSSIKSFTSVITEHWDGHVSSKPWFLALRREQLLNWVGLSQQRHAFEAVRPRFCSAVKVASDDERIVLGESYDRFFGGASRSIHSHIGGLRGLTDIGTITTGINLVGMLCLHIINRAYQLSGIEPIGAAKQITDFWKSGDSIAPRIMASRQEIIFDSGDLVLVNGLDLAEIVRVNSSEYQYKSYVVRYLCNPPLAETPEECIPAMYLRRLIRQKDARTFFESEMSKMTDGGKSWNDLKDLPDSKLFGALRAAFIDLAKRGLLVKLLRQKS